MSLWEQNGSMESGAFQTPAVPRLWDMIAGMEFDPPSQEGGFVADPVSGFDKETPTDIANDVAFTSFPLSDHAAAPSPKYGPLLKITDDADTVFFGCDRTELPDTPDAVIRCALEYSLDGGTTWKERCSFTTNGGQYFEDGVLITESLMSAKIPVGTGRLIRSTLTALVDLRTNLTVMCSRVNT